MQLNSQVEWMPGGARAAHNQSKRPSASSIRMSRARLLDGSPTARHRLRDRFESFTAYRSIGSAQPAQRPSQCAPTRCFLPWRSGGCGTISGATSRPKSGGVRRRLTPTSLLPLVRTNASRSCAQWATSAIRLLASRPSRAFLARRDDGEVAGAPSLSARHRPPGTAPCGSSVSFLVRIDLGGGGPPDSVSDFPAC